jgi:putative ABC transport system permease protein
MRGHGPINRLRVGAIRIAGLFSKQRRDRELDDELHAHLEALVDEKLRQGMNPQDARRAARREFGGIEQAKEAYRDQRGFHFADSVLQDARFALRMLAKSPAFACIAILTLALGIGATTAVFSVVDRVLFRSLPYPQEESLVSFGITAPIEKNEFMLGASYVDFRKSPGPFEEVTSMLAGNCTRDLTEQSPIRLGCALVEQTFLSTLRVQPILGRNFTPEEDRPNGPQVAIISYAIWKSRFGGDPSVLRKTISLDGKTTQIVGVLPKGFAMPTLVSTDVLLPEALDEELQRRSAPGVVLRSFARVKPGAMVSQAIVGLQPFLDQALQGAPPAFRKEIHLSVTTVRDRQIHDVRLASWILLGSVFAVLLVACTNVASLLLARASSRRRELAVRSALGASRRRLIRQSLVESLLLGVLGAAAGCWIAHLLLRLFVSIAPEGIPHLQEAGLDLRVVGFTLVVAFASAMLFGLAPALPDPAPELLGGKDLRSTPRNFLHQMLAASQICISVVLLACAGLLLRSLWNLQRVPTGLDTQKVLAETVSLSPYRYPQQTQQIAFFRELQTRLRSLPGVIALAVSDTLPPAGQMRSTILAAVEPEGHSPTPQGTGGSVGWRAVSPDYFSALGIPILRGRSFQMQDSLSSENPIILSETLAREIFPNENPVGKELKLFRQQTPLRTVVGIAADVRNNGLVASSDPEFYLPWKNDPVESLSTGQIIVRTRMDPAAVAAWMRSETSSMDPTVPVKIEMMSERVGRLAQRPRFDAILLSLFAGLGVLLAAIGVYGVVGFLVTQRTQEIGVRMALGATPHGILKMVLSNIARWTIGGAALGVLGAWFCSRLLQSLLYEVKAHDPILLCVAVLPLLSVAFLAAWVPARRAMRIDPVVALRHE